MFPMPAGDDAVENTTTQEVTVPLGDGSNSHGPAHPRCQVHLRTCRIPWSSFVDRM